MMHGQVALVTGASAGMGRALATALARAGATVVLVSRDPGKGEEARRAIAEATGNPRVELLVADLASQGAIRQLAQEFQCRHDRLHVLVNNAGAHIQERRLSPDSIEANLAVNHLAAFLLTNLLLDTLRARDRKSVV